MNIDKKSTSLPILALFDFDGTLTSRDTFVDFHRFFWGSLRLLSACAETVLLGGLHGRLDRDFLKATLVAHLWKNVSQATYQASARRYAETRLEKVLIPQAMEVFLRHLERGHDVYVVTASMKDWIEPWASKYGVPVLGTELEVLEGKLTGRLATLNCRGPEKTVRIAAAVDLKKYGKIYAYGNSRGDLEMLELADEKVYNWDHIPSVNL
jgi:HAD superfamily hydrolase (TIGR01490 family)